MEPSTPNDEVICFLLLLCMIVIFVAAWSIERFVRYIVKKWPGWMRE